MTPKTRWKHSPPAGLARKAATRTEVSPGTGRPAFSRPHREEKHRIAVGGVPGEEGFKNALHREPLLRPRAGSDHPAVGTLSYKWRAQTDPRRGA